ncbi:hypothetical protein CBL_10580 [Carabus blaptoides fortunei]
MAIYVGIQQSDRNITGHYAEEERLHTIRRLTVVNGTYKGADQAVWGQRKTTYSPKVEERKIPIPKRKEPDNMEDEEERKSKEKITNQEGEKILAITENRGWTILNGNVEGDEEGEYSYIGARGESVIDYVIANERALAN